MRVRHTSRKTAQSIPLLKKLSQKMKQSASEGTRGGVFRFSLTGVCKTHLVHVVIFGTRFPLPEHLSYFLKYKSAYPVLSEAEISRSICCRLHLFNQNLISLTCGYDNVSSGG